MAIAQIQGTHVQLTSSPESVFESQSGPDLVLCDLLQRWIFISHQGCSIYNGGY
jgi:hypothetical protein